MSAERLREAARLMRQGALAANTVPWYTKETLVQGKFLDPVDEEIDAAFIAAMSPVVALDVATLLDNVAAYYDTTPGQIVRYANATADAYLGAAE